MIVSLFFKPPFVYCVHHWCIYSTNQYFLYDPLWISPWIKSISNKSDITIHGIAPQWPGHCDVIGNRLWRYQQNVNRTSETQCRCVKIIIFIIIYGLLFHVRNWGMYVFSWWMVYALLTWVLFQCLFYINTKITLLWAHKPFANRIHYFMRIQQFYSSTKEPNKAHWQREW